jgi:hypothetical protein
MKSKQLLFLLAGLALFQGCRPPRPALVPEISSSLVQEEVCAWTGRLAGDILFPFAGGVGWIDAGGKIINWDVEKKTVAAVFELPFQVTAPPFRQGDLLVLKDQASDHLVVYDLAGGAVQFESLNMRIGEVLAVDRDCLVFLDGERLAVHLWERPAGIFRMAGRAEKVLSCHFSPDRIWLLGREHLITFWKASGKFQQTPLPSPAVSPSYCDGEYIYYGDSQRFLVKFSLSKNRQVWKLKLGQPLERQPFAFAGSLVANPADNNVLQVNVRGSLLWWLALRSTMRFDLVPMNDNLAAFLLNNEIKFIDLGLKRVTEFSSRGNPASQPLALGHDLYFMLQEGDTYKLQRVGNRYGIDIVLEPAQVRWVGQSIRFVLQPCNLLQPSWECEIVDAQGRPVFSRSMAGVEKAPLVWVPLQAGKYLIRVRAKALNRDALGEVPLQVLDPLLVIPGFYLHL